MGFFIDEEDDNRILFKEEPNVWLDTDKESVRKLFFWAMEVKANDINITARKEIILQINGVQHRVTKRELTDQDAKNILYIMFESENALATILSGSDVDFSYSIRDEEGKSSRFRVNVTPVMSRDTTTPHITARTITPIPPKIEDVALEKEILDNMIRDEGIAIVAGSTGTGKSSTLAAVIRDILERKDLSKKILTFEAPIEFVYDQVKKSPHSDIYQTEIYNQLKSFPAGMRGALRRSPDIILIGEARDKETIEQAIIASQTGHLVFTTTHVNGVAETIKRMVNEFDPEERNARSVDLITALNIIVSQKLVPRVGGGRVALREYLIFTREIKRRLQMAELDTLSYFCQQELKKHGQTFFMAAQKKYDEGLISEDTYNEMKFYNDATEKDLDAIAGKKGV